MMSEHVVITGGSRGIGAAIAERLAKLSGHITLMGRNEEALHLQKKKMESTEGLSIACISVDVADEDSVKEAFSQAREKNGDVTALINNAGIVESGPFHRKGMDVWQRMIEVNLFGAVHTSREVLLSMRERKRGRIINIASSAGLRGFPYVTAYCSAKHALVGFTRSLAAEEKRNGIHINAICPGYTDTDLVKKSAQAAAEKSGRSVEDVRAEYAKWNLSGRLLEPKDVAEKVAWLFMPEQKDVTGQEFEL